MSDTRLVTAEELERFPDDDYRYELVEGRLIRMSPVNFDHGRVVMRLGFLLSRHLEQHPVGVIGTEIGFKLASNPDTVRGPDIAFLKNERVPSRGTRGFFTGAPDLVIEVLSPEDRPGEMRQKIDGYLARGVSSRRHRRSRRQDRNDVSTGNRCRRIGIGGRCSRPERGHPRLPLPTARNLRIVALGFTPARTWNTILSCPRRSQIGSSRWRRP